MATIISGDSAGVHTSAAVECLQTIAAIKAKYPK